MSAGEYTGNEIAVVGLACRVPGARSAAEFWRVLRSGTEVLGRFTDEDLITAGVDPALLADPNYVRAGARLDDVDGFDAPFFGITARDAAISDPQHRHFLECAWEALEDAGYAPSRIEGSVGVFAGCGMNGYFCFNLLSDPDLVRSQGLFLLRHTANDRDFLPTAVSYRLNLRGPSVAVQTACSSALVAVHLACQSLLSGECDTALAGGSHIVIPHGQGYLYRENEVLSPDGRCRSFDANASGTVITSGVGVVALKRLDDAVRDGDTIHAVIRGSAVTNDGSRKAGYFAPSVEGHAAAIAEAIGIAGLSADDLSYVEVPGMGTPIGDPIVIAALTRAFRQSTKRSGFCRVGSVEPAIGHTDTASGVIALIKVILSLKNGEIPPSLNFTSPNPAIDFAATPFEVNARLTPWASAGAPRRAGVSALGIGGTNAHVIVEEAPLPAPTDPAGPAEVLVLSARTAGALDSATARLIDYLEQNPAANLGDVAHTLQAGREAFDHRRAVVCSSGEDAARALRSRDPSRVFTGQAGTAATPAAVRAADRPMAAARTWVSGGGVDWTELRGTARRRRLPLPTYPFEHQRYWIDAKRAPTASTEAVQAAPGPSRLDSCFARPVWRRRDLPVGTSIPPGKAGPTLVFLDPVGVGKEIAAMLRARGETVITVREGDAFYRFGENEYALLPEAGREAYDQLVADLASRSLVPARIVHLWLTTAEETFRPGSSFFHRNQEQGFYSLLFLSQALAGANLARDLHLMLVSTGMQSVAGEPVPHPEKAAALGPVKVIPREFPGVTCSSIDIVLPPLVRGRFGRRARGSPLTPLAEALIAELEAPAGNRVIALRDGARYEQEYERSPLGPVDSPGLRTGGTYLVTGGLGAIGLLIADHLARKARARLVLVGRGSLPERDQWDDWLSSHPERDRVSRRLRRLMAIERDGGEVLALSADVADVEAMRRVLAAAHQRFGPIHGVFHAAGVIEEEDILSRTPDGAERVFTPKVHGTRLLAEVLAGEPLEFLVLFSSTSSVLGPAGQVDYAAANAFLDAFARSPGARAFGRTVAINWGTWRDIGMASGTTRRGGESGGAHEPSADAGADLNDHGITAAEGLEALERVLARPGERQVVFTSIDLEGVRTRLDSARPARAATPAPPRASEGPRDDVERRLVAMWQDVLGTTRVGIHDDFFNVGGHSLIAVRLFSQVKKAFGVTFPLSALFEAPTVAQLAALVRDEVGQGNAAPERPRAPRRAFKFLVPANDADETAPPLFIAAGMFGNVLNLRHIAAHLGHDQPVYAIQAKGLLGDDAPHETFEEMATDYLAEMRQVQPRGPYFLGGFSGGGIAMFEMAHRLLAEGEKVAALIMLDAYAPRIPRLTWHDRMWFQWAKLRAGGPAYVLTWARSRAAWEFGRLRGLFEAPLEPTSPAEFRSEKVREAFDAALPRYQARPYPGRITLFRPHDEPIVISAPGRALNARREFIDPANFWTPYARGVDVHVVPGDHDSMLLEPHVRALAARLKKCLIAARAQTAPTASEPEPERARAAAAV